MIYEKEKLDRMFTEYLKISLSHSYKIHQNLQPPLDFGAPSPKGPAYPCRLKICQSHITENLTKNLPVPYNRKFKKITSPTAARGA